MTSPKESQLGPLYDVPEVQQASKMPPKASFWQPNVTMGPSP